MFWKTKEEPVELDRVIINTGSSHFPKSFSIITKELGTFDFTMDLKIPHVEYLQQFDIVKRLSDIWLSMELDASNEGLVDFREKIKKINISSIPAQLDTIDSSLEQADKMYIRLMETMYQIEVMVDSDIVEYLRARYIWHLIQVFELNDEIFTLVDICYMLKRHPWIWILPIMRVTGIN